MVSGLAAFVYAAALWYAAPAFCREAFSIADRLRMVLVLGVAIPGVLAFAHLLYAPLLWLAAFGVTAYGFRNRRSAGTGEPALYVTLAATLLVVWPPLARPLLDGDSLLYHLPNAAAFVQDHSVWTARAPYWLYPPASELFAAGLFAASGRWSLPLAGILPALLLTARLYSLARRNGASAAGAGAVALAFICTPVAAFQAGTLQNDLWLAAFFVEVLSAPDRSPLSLALCALLKPYGWIEGCIAAAAARVPLRAVAVAFVPLLLWAIRDAVLLAGHNAAGFTSVPYLASTIAGNVTAAVPQLANGIARVTPQAFLWFAAIVAGFAFADTRRYAAAGAAAFALYAVLPVSYTNGVTNYVADASSLRYALPALACGAAVSAVLVKRLEPWSTALCAAIAVWGVSIVLGVFWNDSYTHWAIGIALLVMACAAVAARTRSIPVAATVLAVFLAGSWAASSRAQGFYGDWMRQPDGNPTHVFSWIARHRPSSVVAVNVRPGAVLMSSPNTRVTGEPSAAACPRAGKERGLLLVGTNEDASRAAALQLMQQAKTCGTPLYEDGAAVVVQPP